MKTTCRICPRHCSLVEGQSGACKARKNSAGKIVCSGYGKITALAFDPIEKKPLRQYMPGSYVFSIGSYGCNFRCPWCQNSDISTADEKTNLSVYKSPEEIVKEAYKLVPDGNIGIAYTYNEPFISFEYIMDCAKLAHEYGLKNIVVTNGYICEEPLLEILPYIDAMNIDLKGFRTDFYDQIQGNLESVKQTIALAGELCHIELTTLIIPEENDRMKEMEEMCKWISSIRRSIPLHITRFYPRYMFLDKKPTDIEVIVQLAETAKQYLDHVYIGNC